MQCLQVEKTLRKQFVSSFPPFSMIWPILKKILESIKSLVIAPQLMVHKLLELVVEQPMIIVRKYLQLSGTNQNHPLYIKLILFAMMCSRDRHKQKQFRKKQSISLMQHEEMQRKTNINTYSDNRKNFVVK